MLARWGRSNGQYQSKWYCGRGSSSNIWPPPTPIDPSGWPKEEEERSLISPPKLKQWLIKSLLSFVCVCALFPYTQKGQSLVTWVSQGTPGLARFLRRCSYDSFEILTMESWHHFQQLSLLTLFKNPYYLYMKWKWSRCLKNRLTILLNKRALHKVSINFSYWHLKSHLSINTQSNSACHIPNESLNTPL